MCLTNSRPAARFPTNAMGARLRACEKMISSADSAASNTVLDPVSSGRRANKHFSFIGLQPLIPVAL